jgi:uncharacterized cupin superfamily protein
MRLGNIYEGRTAEFDQGHIKGVWRDPAREAGSRGVGLRRIDIAPEHFSTPAHEHGAEEEIFFVLAGAGLLWQDGRTYEVVAGDCIVHRPRRGAHTLRAGADGLDVLVYGQRIDPSLTALPRVGVAWSFPHWVELAAGDSPFAREGAAGPPECPEPEAQRPANVVAFEDAEAAFGGRARMLARSAGARDTGLNHVTLSAGEQGAPAHCHSAEEELFAVLDGGGVLELWEPGANKPAEEPLGRGDVISRPAGTGVAHALRPGEGGIAYLAYGTREPADMCFYPAGGRISFRGLGIALSSPQIEPIGPRR